MRTAKKRGRERIQEEGGRELKKKKKEDNEKRRKKRERNSKKRAGCASTIISQGEETAKTSSPLGRGSNDDASSDRVAPRSTRGNHGARGWREGGRERGRRPFISVDSFYRRRSVDPDDEFSFICFHTRQRRDTLSRFFRFHRKCSLGIGSRGEGWRRIPGRAEFVSPITPLSRNLLSSRVYRRVSFCEEKLLKKRTEHRLVGKIGRRDLSLAARFLIYQLEFYIIKLNSAAFIL